MKITKKLLPLLLSMAMILTFMPFMAFAENEVMPEEEQPTELTDNGDAALTDQGQIDEISEEDLQAAGNAADPQDVDADAGTQDEEPAGEVTDDEVITDAAPERLDREESVKDVKGASSDAKAATFDRDDACLFVAGYPIVSYDYDDGYAVNPSLPKGVSYNISSSTLTLNNYTGSTSGDGIRCYSIDRLNIVLKGNNTITAGGDGISAGDQVGISGTGTLTLNIDNSSGYQFGIQATNVIDISNCTVNIKGVGTQPEGYFYGMSLRPWDNYYAAYEAYYEGEGGNPSTLDFHIKIKGATVNISNTGKKEECGVNLGIDAQDANVTIENSKLNITMSGGGCWGICCGLDSSDFSDHGIHYFGGKLSIDKNSWIKISLNNPSSRYVNYNAIYALYYFKDNVQSKYIYAGNTGTGSLYTDKSPIRKNTSGINNRLECVNYYLELSPYKATLASNSYTETGKEIKPAVTVSDVNGNTIASGNYTVTYKNNIKPGTASAVITFKGSYSGTITRTFRIYQKTNLKVKSLWASEHGVGKVLFKWTQKPDTSVTGWNLKYRTRKIGGNNSWSGWTNKSYGAGTLQAWINVPVDYVIEIHAQAKGDTTWSTGIITCPAGGKYQAMKTTHVINVATGKRLAERTVSGSSIKHTTINLKVGKTIKVRPDYDYPVSNYTSRPRLYPSHLLYDIGNSSMITITKPDGTKYTGGIIDGTATIKATKAGSTTIIFRSPNGRTLIADVKIS